MTYVALNTVTKVDAEHARQAIIEVSNVVLLNWKRQSLAIVCYTFLSFHPLFKIALNQSRLYCEMMFAVAERNSGWDENRQLFNCDLTLGYTSKSNGARYEKYGR